LRDLSERAWTLFGLKGTARVDFRVDETGRPLVLEVNPNPGIAPDAGLAAAAERAGLSYAELIERIVLAALP
jgi:D-alanine-D-alanine ligase